MKIAILGLGESSKLYPGPDTFDAVLGCNRCAHFWKLDYTVALDASTLRHYIDPTDEMHEACKPLAAHSKLVAKADHWKRACEKWPAIKKLFDPIEYAPIRDKYRRVGNWTSCAALATADHIGAKEIYLYGFDFNGSPDPDGTKSFKGQNRTDTRWANEKRAFEKMVNVLRDKGIVVHRLTVNGDIEQTIDRRRAQERAKYEALWEKHGAWGTHNHGSKAQKLILTLSPATLLDVGCGDNKFAKWARSEGILATGVDFAGCGADIKAAAHDLPFKDNAFDVVTAFDVMEHLLPEEVDEVLEELVRVGRSHLVLGISYRESRVRALNGETLHPTIRPKDWWVKKLCRFGNTKEWNNYLHVELNDG